MCRPGAHGVVVLSGDPPRRARARSTSTGSRPLRSRCRAWPGSPTTAPGGGRGDRVELLASDTAEASLALAATVGDGLAWPRRLTSRSG